MELLDAKTFAALSKEEKIVAICRDVIYRMDSGLIEPHNGDFFRNKFFLNDTDGTPQTEINTKECEVCAKGALMCSWVGNFNNYDWDAFYSFNERMLRQEYPRELTIIFGETMLDNIEAAFEGNAYSWHINIEEALRYVGKFEKGDLRGIMNYIIENNGTFPVPFVSYYV